MAICCSLSIVTTSLIGILTAIIGYFFFKYHINHYWKFKNLPFEQSSVPFLGLMFQLLKGKAFHVIDGELYRKHGKVFGAYEGVRPVIYVSDPDLLRDIYIKDFHSFANRRDFRTGEPVIDSMITILKDEEWKRVRSIISPTFTTGKLKGMMQLVGDCATLSTGNFIKAAESGGPIECKRLFSNYTLDVIASVAFGTKLDSHNDPDNVFVTNARKSFNTDMNLRNLLAMLVPRVARMMGSQLFQIVFFIDLVKEIIERRKETKEIRNDFLQLMIEKLEDNDTVKEESGTVDPPKKTTTTGSIPAVQSLPSELDWSEATEDEHEIKEQIVYSKKTLSLTELIAQSVIFFLAGYDTTATTLSMICYNLARNPEAQKKVTTEVDEIWKRTKAVEAVTANETRYVDAVIKETLRLYPPAARIERTTGQDYALGNTGFVIPKGMVVISPIYSMQRDPEHFSEPDEFIPERFLPENLSSVNPFTYLPFGSGPRNCIAMRLALMEIKINLIYLLREVQFDVCPETKSPPDYYNGNFLLQPKSINLKVTRRNQTSFEGVM